MRRLFLGSLVVAALAASGGAFAVEASVPGVSNPPSAPPAKHASTNSKKRPVPLSEALGSTPTTELPVGSAQTPTPSTQSPWTGVYVGGGGGMAK